MFAHVYCPDLLVQCERLFRPEFKSQALVIHESIAQQDIDHTRLLACSSEARALGFEVSLGSEKLGQLIERFSCKQAPQILVQCQPNKELYVDMSKRLFSSLKMLAPSVTLIASDEACLDLAKLKRLTSLTENRKIPPEALARDVTEQLQGFAYELRHTIKQWLGLDIFVGVGTSKTLAYLGCKAAEREYDQSHHNTGFGKLSDKRGTTVLTSSESNQSVLAKFPTSEIRGISSKALSKLSELGIHTALELSQASSQLIGKRCSVLVEHIAIELSGLTSQLTSERLVSNQLGSERLSAGKGVPSVIKTEPANKLMGGDIQEYLASYTKARLKTQRKGPYKSGVPIALLRIAAAMLNNAHKELKTRQLNCHTVEINVERADLLAEDNIFIDGKSISLPEPSSILGPIKKLCRHILESIVREGALYRSISLTLKCQAQDKAKQVSLFEVLDGSEKVAQLGIDASTNLGANLGTKGQKFMLIQRYCELHDLSNKKISLNSLRRLPMSPAYTSQWHELLRVN